MAYSCQTIFNKNTVASENVLLVAKKEAEEPQSIVITLFRRNFNCKPLKKPLNSYTIRRIELMYVDSDYDCQVTVHTLFIVLYSGSDYAFFIYLLFLFKKNNTQQKNI